MFYVVHLITKISTKFSRILLRPVASLVLVIFLAGISILWSAPFKTKAVSLVTFESYVSSEYMAFPADQSIGMTNVPADSTLVLFSSYRNPNGGNIFSASTSNYDDFTLACRDANSEYVTEAWYLAPYDGSFDVYINWQHDVEDVRTGIAIFSGVDINSGAVTGSYCGNDWNE